MFGRGARSREVKSEEQISFEFARSGSSDDIRPWHPMAAVVILFGSSAVIWVILLLYVFELPI